MTREELIRMAREAGYPMEAAGIGTGWLIGPHRIETLERFAELVAAAEREACAVVCEDLALVDEYDPGESFAAAIRKLKVTK